MKKAGIICLLFAFHFAAAAQASTQAGTSSDEAQVKEAVSKMIDGWRNNDADALEKLWASDYTFANPSGVSLNKSQRLQMLRSGRVKVEDYTIDLEKIRIYGDAAVVTYRSTVKRQSEGHEVESEQHLVLTVLIKQNGQWLAVAQQSTPVTAMPVRMLNK